MLIKEDKNTQDVLYEEQEINALSTKSRELDLCVKCGRDEVKKYELYLDSNHLDYFHV